MNESCISKIYVTQSSDGSVHIVHTSTHTNHSLAIEDEAKSIPLPKSTQDEISAKLQQGIPVDRIMEGNFSYVMYITATQQWKEQSEVHAQ